MTSVKEFRIDEEPTATELGKGAFVFTDDYSVFDWGKMPDEIPAKGASLCTMGAYNFEQLDAAGIGTHYEGVLVDGELTDLQTAIDAGSQPREMAISLTQVPKLPHETDGYDYEAYHDTAGENYLVPLEIVFRNTVPVGSSLRERSAPPDHGLDTAEWPDEVVELPEPVVEFSTKYEEQDRYLPREEADRIAGQADIDALEAVAREVNEYLNRQAAEAGFAHEDGKIECLYYQGEIYVADVVGTFDENRFSYEGKEVSKEVIRQYHKRTQPAWVEAVSEAKATASERNRADWKALCERQPEPLEGHSIEVASNLYQAGTNAYVGQEVFDAPAIEDTLERVERL
ncbi:phosphoribosylaminoimidazolesuccinocarboxamide synthase [Halorhabdus sp. CBA1104]|uniref:phosphoribosylaminoimidazolesuccinocarboxamide synthase n=1 Tax=Halorhabdus sp. CBA1104 TaxID=1380432 RepID=UPI0012B2FAA5|nr:phosphoribosylaminoimidazolesuccinocarboxamide synthase [Halorhabdus sp. CBA1104]QGN06331.1 phosphoribosylaminoimidazolesuccinocarboxamide synthase [Halorhabdus sp. CBA1104]